MFLCSTLLAKISNTALKWIACSVASDRWMARTSTGAARGHGEGSKRWQMTCRSGCMTVGNHCSLHCLQALLPEVLETDQIQFLKSGKFCFLKEVRIVDGCKLSIPSMESNLILVVGNIRERDFVTYIYSKMKRCMSSEFELVRTHSSHPCLMDCVY